MSLSDRPKPDNINNSVLSSKGAMPQKSLLSVNENPFSMNRVLYSRTVQTYTKEDNTIKKEKHYYGNRNSDASSVMERKKLLNAGRKNYLGNDISHQSERTINDVRDAKKRVRSSGSIVPAKVTHKYDNAPIFY